MRERVVLVCLTPTCRVETYASATGTSAHLCPACYGVGQIAA